MADAPPRYARTLKRLAGTPWCFAETPTGGNEMDALSEVLRVIRLTGGVFLEASFTAPWSVRSHLQPEDIRNQMERAGDLMVFHYIVEGSMLLRIDGVAPVEVKAGEVVLIPHNDAHILGSDLATPAVDTRQLMQFESEGALASVRHGGGGSPTRMVCGFIGSEARRHPLIDALPRVLALDLGGLRGADLITTSFRFAAQEVAAARPGSASVLSRLSELMFVETVREYIARLPQAQSGWLAGLRDSAVGRALALIHARPAEPWTAESLAEQALLSRSAFAERFTVLVGVPPMSYLTNWRMQVAAHALRESRRSIGQIAGEVGYESESTFTRAFKREMGVPPGQYRAGA
jgi:AraC-like DNA-binding protein